MKNVITIIFLTWAINGFSQQNTDSLRQKIPRINLVGTLDRPPFNTEIIGRPMIDKEPLIMLMELPPCACIQDDEEFTDPYVVIKLRHYFGINYWD